MQTNTFLDKIIAKRRFDVEQLASVADFKKKKLENNPTRGFKASIVDSIKNKQCAIIAEIKPASPSAGTIKSDFTPSTIAEAYTKGGASAISVLTEPSFFKGNNQLLQEVRDATHLPLLRKDFIFDERQIYESKEIGADAILLIVSSLTPDQLFHLTELAKGLQLDVLTEVHNEEELKIALETTNEKNPLIGINNRNLKTLTVDTKRTLNLLPSVPEDAIPIAESGIKNNQDIRKLRSAGCYCYLIGEALMRSENPTKTLEKFQK